MPLFEVLGDVILLLVCTALTIATYVLMKKSIGICFKLIYAVLFFTVIVELIGKYSHQLNRDGIINFENNIGVYNIYELIIFPLLFFLYYNLIKGKNRKYILLFIIPFVVTSFIEGLFFTDYTKEYQTYPFIVGSLGLSVSVVFYFTQILEDGSFDRIRNNFFFWLSCGILIYYLGNIPFVSVVNIFDINDEVQYSFWSIAKVLAIIMYILICIGLPRYKIIRE